MATEKSPKGAPKKTAPKKSAPKKQGKKGKDNDKAVEEEAVKKGRSLGARIGGRIADVMYDRAVRTKVAAGSTMGEAARGILDSALTDVPLLQRFLGQVIFGGGIRYRRKKAVEEEGELEGADTEEKPKKGKKGKGLDVDAAVFEKMAEDIGEIKENTEGLAAGSLKIVGDDIEDIRDNIGNLAPAKDKHDPFARGEAHEAEMRERGQKAKERYGRVRGAVQAAGDGLGNLGTMLSEKFGALKKAMKGIAAAGSGFVTQAIASMMGFFKGRFLVAMGAGMLAWGTKIAAAVAGAVMMSLRGIRGLLSGVGRGVTSVLGKAGRAATAAAGAGWKAVRSAGARAASVAVGATQAVRGVAGRSMAAVTGVASRMRGVLGAPAARTALRRIPGVGLAIGAGMAAKRAMSGDFTGAGAELLSGVASTVPGAGTAASVAIDAGLMARDAHRDSTDGAAIGAMEQAAGITDPMTLASPAARTDTSSLTPQTELSDFLPAGMTTAPPAITSDGVLSSDVAATPAIAAGGKLSYESSSGGVRALEVQIATMVSEMLDMMSKPMRGIYVKQASMTLLPMPSQLTHDRQQETNRPTELYEPVTPTSGDRRSGPSSPVPTGPPTLPGVSSVTGAIPPSASPSVTVSGTGTVPSAASPVTVSGTGATPPSAASTITVMGSPSFKPTPVPSVEGLHDDEVVFIREAIRAGITDPKELDAFRAQTKHESMNFRRREEIWNNSAAQQRYEGHRGLGNVNPGDGYKYRGRGFIQLTGRANYEDFARYSGIDVVNNPDLISESPELSAQASIWYWKNRVANKVDNFDDIERITRLINGPGLYGLDDRKRHARNIAANPLDYGALMSDIESAEALARIEATEKLPSPNITATAIEATSTPPQAAPPVVVQGGGGGGGGRRSSANSTAAVSQMGVDLPMMTRNPDPPIRSYANGLMAGSIA